MAKKWENRGADSRKDFRIDMAISIRYRIARRVQGVWQLSPFFKGIGVDFSASGCSFKVAKELPSGYLVYLEIFFPFDRYPVSSVAEIIRVKPDTIKGVKVFKCMAQYLVISPTVQDKMVGFLNQKMGEEKRG